MKILYRCIVIVCLLIFSVESHADNFEVDGIYYETDWQDNTIAIVTSGKYDYKDDVIIPATVNYNGQLLKVTTIGSLAFSMCDALKSVSLPNGLLKIEGMAFHASSLESIIIPSTVEYISPNSFERCNNLKAINVAESNNSYTEVDGVVYDKSKETLICYPSGKGDYFVVPNGTKKIGQEAFAGSKITKIILNDDLLSIGDKAFGSTDLKSITIPAGVKQFGKYIFEYSNPDYIISKIANPESISVTTFEYSEYSSQDNIYDNTILYVPQGTESLYKSVNGWKKFSHIKACDRVEVNGFEYEVSHGTYQATLLKKSTSVSYNEEVEIPEEISYQGQIIPVIGIAENAFKEKRLGTIVLGKNILTIGDNAFNGCPNLKVVTVRMETPITIDENVFEGVYDKATLIVPQTKKAIYSTTFPWNKFTTIKEVDSEIVVDDLLYEVDFGMSTATLLKKNTYVYLSDKIEIPETIIYQDKQFSVTGVAENAFKGKSLSSITFGKNIQTIGDNAFNGCSNLKTVTVKNETPFYIDENVFEGVYDNATLYVPRGKKTIYTTTSPWSKFVPAIKEIDSEITENGIIYEVDYLKKCATVISCSNYDITNEVIIPESLSYDNELFSVQSIEKNAFKNVTRLFSIELPKSILIIGENAFQGCLRLTTVVSDIAEPIAINENVFDGIYSQAVLIVPIDKGSAYSQANGWKNFKSIEEVKPEQDVTLGNLTFHAEMKWNRASVIDYNGTDEYLEIPESFVKYGIKLEVRRVAKSAFVNKPLRTISFPSTITSIAQGAFQDCNNLCALTWNSTIQFPSEVLTDINNPNLLLYLNSVSAIPSGESNYIINGFADAVSLKDADYGNFYCPLKFTAKQIKYTHNYSMETIIGKSQGWETIVLPFDVQQIKTKSGNVVPYAAVVNDNDRFFWLREMSETGFTDAAEIKANIPYIISMPNSKWYSDVYKISGDVEFYSENVEVLASYDMAGVNKGSKSFIPAYQKIDASNNTYVLNVNDYSGDYAPGSVFVRNLRAIRPFECYIEDKVSLARAFYISDYTADIVNTSKKSENDVIYSEENTIVIESRTTQSIPIYNLSGQLVRVVSVNAGRNQIVGLTSGFYIIKGKKYVVM